MNFLSFMLLKLVIGPLHTRAINKVKNYRTLRVLGRGPRARVHGVMRIDSVAQRATIER